MYVYMYRHIYIYIYIERYEFTFEYTYIYIHAYVYHRKDFHSCHRLLQYARASLNRYRRSHHKTHPPCARTLEGVVTNRRSLPISTTVAYFFDFSHQESKMLSVIMISWCMLICIYVYIYTLYVQLKKPYYTLNILNHLKYMDRIRISI